jgi:Protein of unknown function (DUF2846)
VRTFVRCVPLMALLATFLGCATGPRYAEVAGSLARLADGQARMYFYRASAFGGAYQPDVQVNNAKVGNAVPNGVFYRDLAPGKYLVTTSLDQGTQVSLDLSAGDEKYIRLSYRIGFKVYPELVDDSTGKREIRDLAYIRQP